MHAFYHTSALSSCIINSGFFFGIDSAGEETKIAGVITDVVLEPVETCFVFSF